MTCIQETIHVRTQSTQEVLDITSEVSQVVQQSGILQGQCLIYTPHATAAITINENDDPNIGQDLLVALRKMVKDHDGWLHDRIDQNAAAHIKAAIIGPSETIPITNGALVMGTWQNIFLCDFDGPRQRRGVVVSVLG